MSDDNDADRTLPATGTDGLATQHIVIDTSAPSISGVSSTKPRGIYGVAEEIPIIVTFSEPVHVIGVPTLKLNDGGTADYQSGNDTATLTFIYKYALARVRPISITTLRRHCRSLRGAQSATTPAKMPILTYRPPAPTAWRQKILSSKPHLLHNSYRARESPQRPIDLSSRLTQSIKLVASISPRFTLENRVRQEAGGGQTAVAQGSEGALLPNVAETEYGGAAQELEVKVPDVVMVQFQAVAPEVQVAELSDVKPDAPELPQLKAISEEPLTLPKPPVAAIAAETPSNKWYILGGSSAAFLGSLVVLLGPTYWRRRRAKKANGTLRGRPIRPAQSNSSEVNTDINQ